MKTLTDTEILEKATEIERQPDGAAYATLPVASLTGEQFAEIIMAEVRKLQSQRQASKRELPA